MNSTLDFIIKSEKENRFKLEVIQRGDFHKLSESSFDYDVSFLTDFTISRIVDQKHGYQKFEDLKAFGNKLYEKLFNQQIEKIWQEFKEKSDFLTLCLRITDQAKSLESFPWETIFDGKEFIAAGVKTSLIRLPFDVDLIESLPEISLPINMLALLSSPLDLQENERLAIEKEQEILLCATNSAQGKLLVEFEDEAKLSVIENCFETEFNIFHYSGHGIPPELGGGLLLEDLTGKKQFTRNDEVLESLEKAKNLRLAVLCGCQTAKTLNASSFQSLAHLMIRKVPSVIAMQFSITDDAGLIFAKEFYPLIIQGRDLHRAMSACRRILLQNENFHIKCDAFAPVLFLKNSNPLKTGKTESIQTKKIEIKYNFYVPLAQLSFGFYGRRREYRTIRDGLLYKNYRAAIIHGIGGIGKTALITHTALRLKEQFQGVYAFDCRSGTLSPDMILYELNEFLEDQKNYTLQQLKNRSFNPVKLATFMGQVLSQMGLLIIFDNFETQLTKIVDSRFRGNDSEKYENDNGKHQIRDENLRTFIKTLVGVTASGSRFVFTSRYLFDLDDNRIGTIQTIPLTDLNRAEALGLMQKLPNIAQADFSDKIRAYEKFGGHPFALVTLNQHCTQKSLMQALDDAEQVSTELREFIAIEMNYSKLSEKGRELLNRFAAFREPVEFDAVHWVIQELSENTDKLTQELINWGMVTPMKEDDDFRLSVHTLVRDFCKSKIDKDIWHKHLCNAADYYTNRSKFIDQDQKTEFLIFGEIQAFELLFEAEEFQKAASIVIAAYTLLDRWGFSRVLESLYNRVLGRVKQETEANIIHNLGILYKDRGEYRSAIENYERSLTVYEQIGDKAHVAKALHQIGTIREQQGEYKSGLEYYEKSLKIKEEIGDRSGIAKSLGQIGIIYQKRGEYKLALEQYQRAMKIFEEIGNKVNVAGSLHQIGRINELQVEYKSALEYYEKSLKIREEIGDRLGIAQTLHQIGNIHYSQGEYKSALEHYEKSLKIKEELGNRLGIANSLHQIGMIHQDQGENKSALEYYEKSLKVADEIGDRVLIATSLANIGTLFGETGRFEESFENLFIALNIFLELESPNAKLAINDLTTLRQKWGAKEFDSAWKNKTGQDVPDVFLNCD